jgi:REP element-mobilizing transposase RayT
MKKGGRIEVAGGFHHVMSRGNQRAPIFLDELDYVAFLRRLSKVIERFEWLCHGFCLMPNHYHLLIETPHPNRGAGMHVLNLSYARHFNWRHGHVGHVFQGPYTTVHITRDAHLMELSRYLAMNPVRAGLVADPADWPWSSYRATAGLEHSPPYLHVDRMRAYFAWARSDGTDEFRDFVAAASVTLALAA